MPSKSLIKRTLYNLGIPLIAGGIFALIFLLRGDLAMAITMTLTFYGLALINVSKYTLDEVHYLGLTEVVLGIVARLEPLALDYRIRSLPYHLRHSYVHQI